MAVALRTRAAPLQLHPRPKLIFECNIYFLLLLINFHHSSLMDTFTRYSVGPPSQLCPGLET